MTVRSIGSKALTVLRRRLLPALLLLTAFVLGIRGEPNRAPGQGPTLREAVAWFPAAHSVVFDSAARSFSVQNGQGRYVGRIVDSDSACPGYSGYGGILCVRIALTPDDRIIAVELRRHRETKSYVAHLTKRGFLDRWDGMSAQSAVEREVATVTGATVSCVAIGKTLRHSLANVYGHALPATLNAPRSASLLSMKRLVMYGIIAFGIGCIAMPARLNKYRRLLLLAAVLGLGMLNGATLSLSQMHQGLVHGFGFSEQLPIVILLATGALTPILVRKNIYCSCLCPFGAIQELLGSADGSSRPFPQTVARFMTLCRDVVLGGLCLLLLLEIEFDLASIEPFGVFSMQAASGWVLLMAATILVVSVFYPRLWCRLLCPTGRILGMLGRCAILPRIRRRSDRSSRFWRRPEHRDISRKTLDNDWSRR